MAIGDVYEVESAPGWYYVDTGMYDAERYGSVFIVDAERPAIVDSGIGTDRDRIRSGLETVGIEPSDLEVIVATHVHLDHAGGAGFLSAETGADVYVHESGANFLREPDSLWEGTRSVVGSEIQHYTEPEPVDPERLVELQHGDVIDLGTTTLEAHHAPGHAFHQMAFHDPGAEMVFCGDAAGLWAPGLERVAPTSPPPGFHLEKAVADAEMIADLDPRTLGYGHFGAVPTGDKLETIAELLPKWVDRIEAKRAELDSEEAVVEYFVEQTDLHEAWGERRAEGQVDLDVRGVLHYLDEQD